QVLVLDRITDADQRKVRHGIHRILLPREWGVFTSPRSSPLAAAELHSTNDVGQIVSSVASVHRRGRAYHRQLAPARMDFTSGATLGRSLAASSSRLLANLHHSRGARIRVAGGGAGGDAPDAQASALGLPYGQPQPPKRLSPSWDTTNHGGVQREVSVNRSD